MQKGIAQLVGIAMALLGSAVAASTEGLSAKQIEEISQVAREARESSHLPALSVAVVRDGKIWSAAFGMADLEQQVPATTQSMLRTASIGKWFTATAAMRLVEDGKLDLDAPVQKYCRQFPTKAWPVTTRQLLSHLAGVRHYYGDNGEKKETDAERASLETRIERERAGQFVRYTNMAGPLAIFKDDPLLFEPGTKSHYSSLGFRLLGCVLEGAAQMPYRQLMRDLVFAPAGMSSSWTTMRAPSCRTALRVTAVDPTAPSCEPNSAMSARTCRPAAGSPRVKTSPDLPSNLRKARS